jgi:hypothetical protein
MGLVNKTISVFVPKDAAARKIAKKKQLDIINKAQLNLGSSAKLPRPHN